MVKSKKSSKEKSSSSKPIMSTKERMMARKKQFETRGSNSGIIYPKEGTMRLRLISQGPDKELGIEVIQFYLGKDLGSIISPATFDEPCPFMEKYMELKSSNDEDDQTLAKELSPRRRYILGCTCYKDNNGKEIDPERVRKPILTPRSIYQDIIDLYLDEDDWGDMTDKENGYDIKITRSGKGKNDTSYSVSPCPNRKPLKEKYVEDMDLEEIVRSHIKSYDELEKILNQYLSGNIGGNEEDDDEDYHEKKPKKKDKSSLKKKLKKKVRHSNEYEDDLPF